MFYIVSYDLDVPGQKYELLADILKRMGSFSKLNKSTYMLNTTRTALEIKRLMLPCLDANDRLFISRLIPADMTWQNVICGEDNLRAFLGQLVPRATASLAIGPRRQL